MRIAVVGAGISGLGAAHALCGRHEVTVLEASEYIGGHTNTIDVPDGDRTVPVDTGFIVFNGPNYPRLSKLFEQLGVRWRESDMSFSVRCERTGIEWNGSSLNQMFIQRGNLVRPTHWRMIGDIVRFHREAPAALETLDDSVSVGTWLGERGYAAGFATRYLLPLGASLWSCSTERFATFPMRFVIEFLGNHRMLQNAGRPMWRTVVGGSRAYIAPLIAPFADRIHLGRAVDRVTRSTRGARGVEVRCADGSRDTFDEVVLACHADQALELVSDIEPPERELLEAFPYQPNEAVLHTDTALLPERKGAWASWNYRVPAQRSADVSVTYNMNMLQGLDTEQTWCVSLNPGDAVAESKVFRRVRYSHPLFTAGRAAAQARHAEMIRRRGLSYCGAYWGFGFHEDGLRSSLDVAAAFDADSGAIAA